MAGSSTGSTGRPPSHSGETSGAGDACPSPCNRGCAPCERTVKFPKSIRMVIIDGYLEISSSEDDSMKECELSAENFLRTISTSAEVETVGIYQYHSIRSGSKEVLKTVCVSTKSFPSLKRLVLSDIDSSLSVSDAEAVFSVVGANSSLQTCTIAFTNASATEAVDAGGCFTPEPSSRRTFTHVTWRGH